MDYILLVRMGKFRLLIDFMVKILYFFPKFTYVIKAHIFSLLLGIPHVLIDNRIGKLSAYHNTWTYGCPKVQRANSRRESLGLIRLYFNNGWEDLPEYKAVPFGTFH